MNTKSGGREFLGGVFCSEPDRALLLMLSAVQDLFLKFRRLMSTMAIAFVLVHGQGSLSLAFGGCDDADHAAGQQVEAVAVPATQPCGDDDCTGADCCGTHVVAGCCHFGCMALGNGFAAVDSISALTAWIPLHDDLPEGIRPEAGSPPPRPGLPAL